MKHRSESSAVRLLRFLGRVEFTMVLLLGGAVIMTAGSVLESCESREVARHLVYGAAWFDLFLFLVALNLVTAVINRIPIKRHQWGFVITHFSIVLLLVGAGVSRTFGYEGRLAIQEGGKESRLLLDSSEIRARWRAGGEVDHRTEEAVFPVPAGLRAAGSRLQEEDGERPGIRIVEHIRDGVTSTGLTPDGDKGDPGVRFLLTGMGLHAREWLIADSPRFERRDLGPVEVEFVAARSRETFERRLSSEDFDGIALVVQGRNGGSPLRISLPADVGKEISLGPDLTATVEDLFLRARLVNGELTDVPGASLNPAAIVEIGSGGRSETHTVFSRYPDFQMIHGRDEGESLVGKLRLEASSLRSKPLVAIVLGPERRLYAQLSTAAGRNRAEPVSVGESVALGDLGLSLELEGFLESARPEVSVHASAEGQESGSSFVKLEASFRGRSESRWLALGSSERWTLDGRSLEMAFVRETRPLPFAIALEEFELLRHPGSGRPAEYRSRVRVEPISAELRPREAVISMNRPLDVGGFRLFQSSYRLGQGHEPDVTVLSVSRDPGVPIVYVSFGLIVAGIAWYVGGQGRRSKLRSGASSRSRVRPGAGDPGGHLRAGAEGSALG